MLEFGPFTTNAGHPLASAASAVSPDRIRIAAAFATESGVDTLRTKLVHGQTFDSAELQALVGIQSGITQPEALERLMKANHHEVRVPYGAEVLASPGLRGPVFFHPKVYAFENTATGAMAIMSGSANLTFAALSSNVENLAVWTGSASDQVAVAFDAWWKASWTAAAIVGGSFLASYRSARPKLPTPPSIPKSGPTGPPAGVLRKASTMWIELVRKPEGGAFNQAELLLTAHHFFYPNQQTPSKAQPRGLVFADATGQIYENPHRSIRFNGPPLRATGNSMWRVYMPTEREGLVGYQDGDVLVRFERTSTPDMYTVAIAESNGPEAAAWIAASAGVATKPGSRPRRMGWS
jgi:HKD family nuclease